MKNLKVLMILLNLILSNEILAQQDQYVFIEIYSKITLGGTGVSSWSRSSDVKTFTPDGEIKEETYTSEKKEIVHSTQILKIEIEKWSKEGFKLKEFEVTNDGRYLVIMIKEE
jgi:hypothetical protein